MTEEHYAKETVDVKLELMRQTIDSNQKLISNNLEIIKSDTSQTLIQSKEHNHRMTKIEKKQLEQDALRRFINKSFNIFMVVFGGVIFSTGGAIFNMYLTNIDLERAVSELQESIPTDNEWREYITSEVQAQLDGASFELYDN